MGPASPSQKGVNLFKTCYFVLSKADLIVISSDRILLSVKGTGHDKIRPFLPTEFCNQSRALDMIKSVLFFLLNSVISQGCWT